MPSISAWWLAIMMSMMMIITMSRRGWGEEKEEGVAVGITGIRRLCWLIRIFSS